MALQLYWGCFYSHCFFRKAVKHIYCLTSPSYPVFPVKFCLLFSNQMLLWIYNQKHPHVISLITGKALLSIFLNKEWEAMFFSLALAPHASWYSAQERRDFFFLCQLVFFDTVTLPVTHSYICSLKPVTKCTQRSHHFGVFTRCLSLMHVRIHRLASWRVLSCSLLHTPVVT